MWVGYFTLGKQINYFQSWKMYEAPPHSKNINALESQLKQHEKDLKINSDLRLSQVKEHDLLFFSEKQLELPRGSTDIKTIATIEYLRTAILKNDCMLALVTQKAQGDKNSAFSLDCVVDVSKSFYLKMAE
jgi:hypothetical protein